MNTAAETWRAAWRALQTDGWPGAPERVRRATDPPAEAPPPYASGIVGRIDQTETRNRQARERRAAAHNLKAKRNAARWHGPLQIGGSK